MAYPSPGVTRVTTGAVMAIFWSSSLAPPIYLNSLCKKVGGQDCNKQKRISKSRNSLGLMIMSMRGLQQRYSPQNPRWAQWSTTKIQPLWQPIFLWQIQIELHCLEESCTPFWVDNEQMKSILHSEGRTKTALFKIWLITSFQLPDLIYVCGVQDLSIIRMSLSTLARCRQAWQCCRTEQGRNRQITVLPCTWDSQDLRTMERQSACCTIAANFAGVIASMALPWQNQGAASLPSSAHALYERVQRSSAVILSESRFIASVYASPERRRRNVDGVAMMLKLQ